MQQMVPASIRPSVNTPCLEPAPVGSGIRPRQNHLFCANESVSRKHQRCHTKLLLCDEEDCTRAFSTHKDLRRHAKVHIKAEERRGYVCAVMDCGKARQRHIYCRKDNFDRHMRTAHGGAVTPCGAVDLITTGWILPHSESLEL